MPTKVAYLGPEGTYAEEAAFHLARLEKLDTPELLPFVGLRSVIEKVATNICDAAVVPIENSVEGGVTASLDALWSFRKLFIKSAVILPIKHSLLSSGSLNDISEVLSHPQALAQCSGWLSTHLPHALQLPTNSTSEAVKMIKGSHFRAAIASRSSKNKDGVEELAYPINDIAGNCTRFVLLQNAESTGIGDIISLAFSLHSNSPGALLETLSCIAKLGLNMNRIESRPSKRELGEYVFFIDIDIRNAEEEIENRLIHSLKPFCEHLVSFGSYKSQDIDLK